MVNSYESDEDKARQSRRAFFKKGVSLASAPAKEITKESVQTKTFGKKSSMSRRTFVKIAAGGAAVVGLALAVPDVIKNSRAETPKTASNLIYKGRVTQSERIAAAVARGNLRVMQPMVVPVPGGTPDYFGTAPNWAYSPLPVVTPSTTTTNALTGFTVQSGGSGYTTPQVILTGGGGTGATAVARVSNGVIVGLTVTAAGTGYTTPPTVAFRDPSPRARGAAATSVLTASTTANVGATGGMRKFVDSLPGLGATAANNLGQYLPVAVADTTTFPGSDYYEIELREYSEKMHSDLPLTRLRGYVQVRNGVDVAPIHYLGPIIVATRNRPVRVKFTNRLPTGAAGNLFIPVDTTYMGAGAGPTGGNYPQNRGTLHLHGGNTVWISDGTAHQWTTPAGEVTSYPKGVSTRDVPDMPATAPGEMTFFYSNQQSARLMFYHDHALGITRLNVYAGMAAGYVLTDTVEQGLITAGTLPSIGIPLVIQDKTFVDATTVGITDPTWNWGTGASAGPVTSVAVTAGGTGYTAAPTVTLTGGGGTGATATATVAGGGVTAITITNPGTGYTSVPTVAISGGGGTGATAVATIGIQGVSAITVNTAGSGYTAPPTVAISGGGGTGATAAATIGAGGISAITVTNPGSGYATAPTVAFSGGGGSAATATATVVGGPLLGIVVTNGGRYVTTPTVTISGGGGTGATATATLTGGIITSITLTAPGTGYTTQPTIAISGAGGGAATATLSPGAGTISAITIGNPGTGYTSAPTVTISGGGGTGATATASVPANAGTVVSIAVTNPGTGYTGVPTVTISGGGGTGATATATVMSGITSITITNAGTGYTTVPTVAITGGGGTGAAATATIGGRVTAVTVTAGGAGYTSSPTVAFSGGGGTGAAAVASITGVARTANTGDLWFPHVYMPNQNPYTVAGANPMGRWDYGPWFWPPFVGLTYGPVPNPYFGPAAPWEPPVIPGTPNPSGVPEAFMDTPIVNGTAYPYINVNPGIYRFRILNACNDRTLNLQLYRTSNIISDIVITNGGSGYTTIPSVTISGGGGYGASAIATVTAGAVTAITILAVGSGYTTAPTVTISPPTTIGGVTATAAAYIYVGTTEVGMVRAIAGPNLPIGVGAYPTPDDRAGGFPDPALRGPAMISIGTEGGFLPAPYVINNLPVGYDYNRRSVTVLNVLETALLLGPAERADVLVDFTNFAGQTLILYNDGPAPIPGFDPRFDYYSCNPDQTSTGGSPSTIPGYGPNTRTVMQIRVAAGASSTSPPNDYPAATFAALTTALANAFRTDQDTIIVPQAVYDAAYAATFPADATQYVPIQATTYTFTPIGQTLPITMPLQPKSIIENFDLTYGRMNALLGVEVPNTTGLNQTSIIQDYIDPPTELILNNSAATPIGAASDGTQIWKITHNGVDTHSIHFHLMNVQVINRVGWDGSLRPPAPFEIGWKESVRMNPLEDIIVALRPIAPSNHNFAIPNSIRLLDPTQMAGATMGFNALGPNALPVTVTNVPINYGWEYVWHCHILGHEENDMMRAICFAVPPTVAPSNLNANGTAATGVALSWNNNTPSPNETDILIERATDAAFTLNLTKFNTGTIVTTYLDTTVVAGNTYYYRVRGANTVGGGSVDHAKLSATTNASNTANITV